MRSMLTGYTVNYSETIDNDALRTVRGAAAEGVGDEGREDIRMYGCPSTRKKSLRRGRTITEYRSNIKNTFSEVSFPSRTFWRAARNFFTLRCTSTDSPRRRQRFIGSNRLIRTSHCCSSHILAFRLDIKENEFDVAMIQAELLPWGRAEADMEIGPKSEP